MEPGIHTMDIEAYHCAPGVSKTGLDALAISPAHYWRRHQDPERPAPKARAGQLEGNLAHCAVLEPAEFARRYAVGPAVNRNAAAWKAFVADNAGRIAIQPDQYEVAMRQADAVRALPEVCEALAHGAAEVSAFWRDPETQVLCRCRPDWAHDCGSEGVILLDLKTCSDASAAGFARQAARKSYHRQDAHYSDGYAQASGRPVLAFIFAAVEDEWPYAANALMLDDASKEQGRRECRRLLATYAQCQQSGVWPGYGSAIQLINLPRWAMDPEETAT